MLFGGHMEDTRPVIIREALALGKRDIDLEKDLDVLDYNYRHARSSILNELSRIRMRIGELVRKEGIEIYSQSEAKLNRSKGAR